MSIKYNKKDYLEKDKEVELLYGVEVPKEIVSGYENFELNERDLKKNQRKNKRTIKINKKREKLYKE